MFTAINSLKLLSLIIFWLMIFLGLGWLVVGPVLHGSLFRKKREILLLQEIPLMLVSGMILNYGIVFIFQSLKISLIIETIVSLFGFTCFLIHCFKYNKKKYNSSSLIKWVGFAFLCLLFLGPILANSLYDWDARAIWFFHAKMIFWAKSVGLSAGWLHPSVILDHMDYPNLVPTLAAQISFIMGFWNENLPKLSLLFMLIPVVLWLFTFSRKSFSFVFLLLLFPFSIYPLIWNGYMDGYLAFYFAIAMLLYGRYLKTSQTIDLISSIYCLLFLFYIKNEGALAALCGIFTIILIAFLHKKPISLRKLFQNNWKYLLAFIIAILPFGIWTFYKQKWGLTNDLQLGTKDSFLRIFTHLSDGTIKQVLSAQFNQIETALMILSLLYFVRIVWKKRIPKESLPALITALIYSLGITVIYLLTPYELSWQLTTSIERTMLSANCCIYIGCYFLLDTLISKEEQQKDPAPIKPTTEPITKTNY